MVSSGCGWHRGSWLPKGHLIRGGTLDEGYGAMVVIVVDPSHCGCLQPPRHIFEERKD